MNCQELDSMCQPYLDGEFQPEERLEVEAHLTGCAECARRVHLEASARHALRRAARQATDSVRAPEGLRERLRGGLRLEQRRATQHQWLRASAAMLVVGLVGVATARTVQSGHRQRVTEDVVLRHVRQLPPEISGPSHELVEAWFDGKLDHPVTLPRLQDMRVSGARISNVTDHPAAYVSYERVAKGQGLANKRIGLFVFDDAGRDVEASALPGVEVNSIKGYNVATWREGEIVYELVTDLDESDIRRMLLQQAGRGGAGAAEPGTPAPFVQPAALQP